VTQSPAFVALLEVQAHDTRLDQLRHQLEALPAREQRDGAAAALAATRETIDAERAARDDLARDQKRLDDEVELLGAKRKGFDAKLYGGTVSNPRELQDLQEEIDALGRRISQLEDEEIAIMEKVEPIEAGLAELATTEAQREAVLADAEERLAAAEADLQEQLAAELEARTATATGVPEALLAEYDKLRAGRGGIGVARLVGSQCGGCHLTLSAMEVARLRKLPDDELAHCEECGRILVP
jgi:predicted  nucleic acid-binding Zn-ribbon protein